MYEGTGVRGEVAFLKNDARLTAGRIFAIKSSLSFVKKTVAEPA